MLITAICILGICVSVYLAYTCEEIRNQKAKILLGIFTAVLFISSCVAFMLTIRNAGKEVQSLKVYVNIVRFFTVLVFIGLIFKIKRLRKYRKAQDRIKIREDV